MKFLIAARTSATLLLALVLQAQCKGQQHEDKCLADVYEGFDTRLDVSPVTRFTIGTDPPVAFRMFHGAPIVAFTRRLTVQQEPGKTAFLASFKPISNLVTTVNDLYVAHETSLDQVTPSGLKAVNGLENQNLSNPAGSGMPSLLIPKLNQSNTSLMKWIEGSVEPRPIFLIDGILKRMSWNVSGFAAIVNQTLMTLDSGSSVATFTANDPGFSKTKDLCIVGPSRAVVAFDNTVVLYVHGIRTILVVMAAHCDWDGSHLYLLDDREGFVWRIANLDSVGDLSTTASFLNTLTERARKPDDEGMLSFRELSRFVGVSAAASSTNRINDCALGHSAKRLLPEVRK